VIHYLDRWGTDVYLRWKPRVRLERRPLPPNSVFNAIGLDCPVWVCGGPAYQGEGVDPCAAIRDFIERLPNFATHA
jgi:hypothetical protein